MGIHGTVWIAVIRTSGHIGKVVEEYARIAEEGKYIQMFRAGYPIRLALNEDPVVSASEDAERVRSWA